MQNSPFLVSFSDDQLHSRRSSAALRRSVRSLDDQLHSRRSSAALRRSVRSLDDQLHSDSQGALLRGGDFRLSHLWDFRKYDRFPLTVVKLSPTLDKGGQGLTLGSALLPLSTAMRSFGSTVRPPALINLIIREYVSKT